LKLLKLSRKNFQNDVEWCIFYYHFWLPSCSGFCFMQDIWRTCDVTGLSQGDAWWQSMEYLRKYLVHSVEIFQGWCTARTTHCDSGYDVTVTTLTTRPLPSQNKKKCVISSSREQAFLSSCCVMSIFAHTHWMNIKSK